jgi:hypothetical protein
MKIVEDEMGGIKVGNILVKCKCWQILRFAQDDVIVPAKRKKRRGTP